jgi:hypothetical protein
MTGLERLEPLGEPVLVSDAVIDTPCLDHMPLQDRPKAARCPRLLDEGLDTHNDTPVP